MLLLAPKLLGLGEVTHSDLLGMKKVNLLGVLDLFFRTLAVNSVSDFLVSLGFSRRVFVHWDSVKSALCDFVCVSHDLFSQAELMRMTTLTGLESGGSDGIHFVSRKKRGLEVVSHFTLVIPYMSFLSVQLHVFFLWGGGGKGRKVGG